MKFLIGLGNPGPKYEYTWHNAGFWLLDEIVRNIKATWDESSDKFQGILGKGTVDGESCIFLKPMTFMNLSGKSVAKVAQFYKIPVEDWVVFHDEIDLARGVVKGRQGGGAGGHNGIRSIIEVTGRDDFKRMKLGVGRPEKLEDGRPMMEVADYLLRPMPSEVAAEYVKVVMPHVQLRFKDLLKRPEPKGR